MSKIRCAVCGGDSVYHNYGLGADSDFDLGLCVKHGYGIAKSILHHVADSPQVSYNTYRQDARRLLERATELQAASEVSQVAPPEFAQDLQS
jgi:hypothetical protein